MPTAPLTISLDSGRTLAFDWAQRISRQGRVRITDHPVEDGATVSDHASALPRVVSVRCGLTETPLDGLTFDQPVGPDRLVAADEFLAAAIGQRLTVLLPDGELLEDWVIEDYSSERGDALDRSWSLRLREVRVAAVTFVTLPVDESLLAEEDVGEQAGTDTSDDVQDEEEDGSILYEIIYGEEQPEGE